MSKYSKKLKATVVRRIDNAGNSLTKANNSQLSRVDNWIALCPVLIAIRFVYFYPLESDLSIVWYYPPFERQGKGLYRAPL